VPFIGFAAFNEANGPSARDSCCRVSVNSYRPHIPTHAGRQSHVRVRITRADIRIIPYQATFRQGFPADPGKWWEGDDMIFVDGEAWPPAIHGTGNALSSVAYYYAR